MFSIFLIVSLNLLLVFTQNLDYKSYKVYNVNLESEDQQNNLHLIKSDVVDFWKKPSVKHGIVGKAMVPPSHFQWFEEQLHQLGVDVDVYIEDVYEYLIKTEDKLVRTKRSEPGRTFDYQTYHRYDDILSHIRSLRDRYESSPTKSVELIEFGRTHENKELVYLKISRASGSALPNKPVIVIESGIVPREWITIPSALYIVEKLLEESHSKYLDDFEWVIVPVVNPDGYEYTHTNLRLWTKSRSKKTDLDFVCPGVHINRNFDFDWSVSDSSSSPCSHIYAGVSALSEIESQLITSILQSYGDRIKMYISIQNSGGFISFPWQYEKAACGLFLPHYLLSREMASAMSKNYTTDVASVAYGDRASGTSLDYARHNGVFFTFNIDIAHGQDGVSVPENEIASTADDVWKAVAAGADNINKYLP